MMKSKKNRISLIVFLAVMAVLAMVVKKLDITVDDLIAWTPSNHVLAFFVIMLFYAVKSLLIFLPVPMLYLVNGHLFSTPYAILINACGLCVSCTEQYLIGRMQGIGEQNEKGNEALKTIQRLQSDNPFFSTYLLRMFHLPMDLVSMFSGREHVSYPWYLLGSLAGMAPSMIGITITGDDILSPASPDFLFSFLMMIVIVAASFVIFYLVLRYHYPDRLQVIKDLIAEQIRKFKKK